MIIKKERKKPSVSYCFTKTTSEVTIVIKHIVIYKTWQKEVEEVIYKLIREVRFVVRSLSLLQLQPLRYFKFESFNKSGLLRYFKIFNTIWCNTVVYNINTVIIIVEVIELNKSYK